MPVSMARLGLSARALRADPYFQADFLALHALPDGVDRLETPGFVHGAAIRPIPDSPLHDLEAPWGYGGPLADDADALAEGLAAWRARQRQAGRVAEFLRLHPFLDPAPLEPHLDRLMVNRETVIVDLQAPEAERRGHYSKGTRYSLRQAEKRLTLRRLRPEDAPLFQRLYEAGLARNQAPQLYYLPTKTFAGMLAAPWCTAWVAEAGDTPVAAAAFLHGGPLCHYHLSGGTDAARDTFAHYLLLETAFTHFAGLGHAWMHLGGGRSAAPDDALLLFKAKFSPHRLTFHIGGLIHDAAAFAGLPQRAPGRILPYRD